MATPDRSTFATLDENCAFVIYQGDLDQYIRTVLMQESTEAAAHTALDFDIVYQTEKFPTLRGNCFAGLDETGVFHIFSGHPGMPLSQSIWSTGSNSEFYTAYFERYSLVLTNDGQVTIYQISRNARYPTLQDKCVWSSTSSSCNAYISSARKATMQTRSFLRRHFSVSKLFTLIAQGRLQGHKLLKRLALQTSKTCANLRQMTTFLFKQSKLNSLQMYTALQRVLVLTGAKLKQVASQLVHALRKLIRKYI